MNTLTWLAGFGFLLLTIVFYRLVLKHLKAALSQSGWTDGKKKRIYNGAWIALASWGVLLSVLSLTGVSGNFDLFPLNVGPILLIPLIGILFITFSGKTKHLLLFVSEKAIVQLQVFRFFVEICLWILFLQNALPVQMTFEGRNLDVLSGVSAPLVALFLSGNKKAMIVWNVLCLGLLINIVTVAILSMSTPFRVFDNEPANMIVTQFPFIFLPGFLVPLAYGLHFLSLRQLLSKG